jgi:hypothetical protein
VVKQDDVQNHINVKAKYPKAKEKRDANHTFHHCEPLFLLHPEDHLWLPPKKHFGLRGSTEKLDEIPKCFYIIFWLLHPPHHSCLCTRKQQDFNKM